MELFAVKTIDARITPNFHQGFEAATSRPIFALDFVISRRRIVSLFRIGERYFLKLEKSSQ